MPAKGSTPAERTIASCPICGVAFVILPWDVRQGRKYCSRRCFHIAHRSIMTARGNKRRDPDVCFWPKVLKSDACWVWIGIRDRGGYGQLPIKMCGGKAHRFSWVIHNGPIPDGLMVLHHCDNPPCVRPDHLFTGTHADNAKDSAIKLRNPAAKLSPNDVLVIRQRRNRGESYPSIAADFGVSKTAIRDLIRGKNWTHV